MNNEVLLIFVKNPVAGQVKTRLAKTIGDEKALLVYQKLLDHTRSVTDQMSCRRQLWYSDFIDQADRWNSGYEKKLQQGSNLGERMKNAFAEIFEQGGEKGVIIGSDCPGLTQKHLENAFEALDQYETVIGPSEDGGYYLLGMNSFYPEVFEGIAWSTDAVYDQTIQTLEKLQLSCRRLPELNDIDTWDDLLSFPGIKNLGEA